MSEVDRDVDVAVVRPEAAAFCDRGPGVDSRRAGLERRTPTGRLYTVVSPRPALTEPVSTA